MSKEKRFTKAESSWIMYDWANSVYATIIMAAIYPIYFASMAPDGDTWWGLGTSIATFTVAILAPVLGAIADHKGMKKKLFTFFLIIGVCFTSLMAIGNDWRLMLVGYVISYIGFSGSCLFYDSFLTDVTTHERMDEVSARGYAMGYIGGSTIPFLVAIVMVLFMENTILATKLSVVLTCLWWAVFSIPLLRDVSQKHDLGELPKDLFANTFKNVVHTVKDIVKSRAILLFMLAYFFYIDGVGTIIHMSTAYGSTLGLDSTGMIIALMVTQLVAAPCAILFAKLSKKVGSIRMIFAAVMVYFVITCVGFYMGFSLEPSQFAAEDTYAAAFDAAAAGSTDEAVLDLRADGLAVLNSADRAEAFDALVDEADIDTNLAAALKTSVGAAMDGVTAAGEYDYALRRSNLLFWIMAVLVGTCQGGIQALSRSYFGKLIPAEKSNEYFGFFDIFGKFAAVLGPLLYAAGKSLTGRSSMGIIALMILFILGALFLFLGRDDFRRAEELNERG